MSILLPEDYLKYQREFLQGMQKKGREANTIKNYQTDLNCFNQFIFGNYSTLKWTQISLSHILDYGKHLEQKYSADNSRRRRIQALRIFFDYLVEINFLNENTVRSLPTAPKFIDIIRPTLQKDLFQLKQEFDNEESTSQGPLEKLIIQRNRVIFELIYTAGLKVSDISHIKREHILHDNYSQQLSVLITHPKKESYVVPLAAEFIPIMQKYTKALNLQMESSGHNFSQLLFNANPHSILAGGISARGIEIIFKEYSRNLEFKLTPKSLRQAGIVKWVYLKHPPTRIKEWMGVAPSYSLIRYTKYLENTPYSPSV